jgi:hypothetical protein
MGEFNPFDSHLVALKYLQVLFAVSGYSASIPSGTKGAIQIAWLSMAEQIFVSRFPS